MRHLIFFIVLLLFSLPSVAGGHGERRELDLMSSDLGLDISDLELLDLNQRGESLALPSQDFSGQARQTWNFPLPSDTPAKSKAKS